MTISTKDAITRFGENEQRVNTFVNKLGHYATNTGNDVETLPSFVARKDKEINSIYSVFTSRGTWATATVYKRNNIVLQNGILYFALVEHTAGTFATDLAANKWAVYHNRRAVDVLEYGADPLGASDSSSAFAAAFATGRPVVFEGTFKFTTPCVYTGTVMLFGKGKGSKILCDGTAFDIRGGSNSIMDNFYMENITAPWIITRDASDWGATVTPVQSNSLGYQPTANDSDIWASLTTAQKNQDIGPVISFNKNASDISVSRIQGRFVSIMMYDTIRSTVRDCNIRAGKNFGGGIVFWNINGQSGNMNAAINNNVRYASFCGIMFANNYDGLIQGNQIEYCGESGIKTYQGTVAGVNACCYNMKIHGNKTKYNYFDGIDISSKQPISVTVDTRYQVSGNDTFGNRMTGFVGDGRNNQVIGNRARVNGLDGFLLDIAYSLFEGNHAMHNNQSSPASGHHEINIPNGDGNAIIGNVVQSDATKTGYAIYAGGQNFCANNFSLNSAFFWGSAGSITATLINNRDNSTGPLKITKPQQIRQEASNIPALTLYNETTSFDSVDMVFHPRKHQLTNPVAHLQGVLTHGADGAENGWLYGRAAQGGVLHNGFVVQTDNALPGKAWLTQFTPNAAMSYTWLPAGSFAVWLDEAHNKLKFVVKTSTGAGKTGEIALTH